MHTARGSLAEHIAESFHANVLDETRGNAVLYGNTTAFDPMGLTPQHDPEAP